MIRDNPNPQYYKTIGKSLARLEEAGYIRKRVKPGKVGKRYEWQTVKLHKTRPQPQKRVKPDPVVLPEVREHWSPSPESV